MTFNIKKHLKLELIMVLIFMLIVIPLTYDMHLFITVFGVCSFIGIFNTIYLYVKLIEQKKLNIGLLMIIFLVSFGLQWVLFSLLAIPIIIIEIISVLSNNVYIGSNSKFMNEQLKNKKNISFLTEKEKELFNAFMSKVKKISIIKWILILIGIIIVFLIQSTINGMLATILIISVLLICLILYFVIRMKIFTSANSDLLLSFLNDCDSLSFYHVSKLLYHKYPNNFIVLESHFTSTNLDDNDYNELKELLKKHKSYHKHSFYLKAVLDVYGVGENNTNFNRFYEKATLENERLFKRFKDVKWSNNLKYLHAQNLYFEGEFVKALEIINSIEGLELKFEKVNHAYIRGKYLRDANRVVDAIENFKYVIEEGNNLRICSKSKEYLTDLESIN